jgi:uncharacterized membrane protein (TIGR02234 family)
MSKNPPLELRAADPSAPAQRSRGIAFAGLLLGGLGGLVTASQAWWKASGGGTSVSFTGNEASGGLTWALPAVLLAGALLALVLRALGRQIVGVLLALVGAGMVLTGALRQRPTSQGVLDRLSQVTLADSFALTSTVWPWLYAAAGLVGATGAVVMLLRARSWPIRTARFERTAAGVDIDLADDPAQAWRALDAGEDPTAEPEPPADLQPDAQPDAQPDVQPDAQPDAQPDSDTTDPDVQSLLTGDTMEAQGGSTRRELS